MEVNHVSLCPHHGSKPILSLTCDSDLMVSDQPERHKAAWLRGSTHNLVLTTVWQHTMATSKSWHHWMEALCSYFHFFNIFILLMFFMRSLCRLLCFCWLHHRCVNVCEWLAPKLRSSWQPMSSVCEWVNEIWLCSVQASWVVRRLEKRDMVSIVRVTKHLIRT